MEKPNYLSLGGVLFPASPKDEHDADQRGLNYAYAAGYRPDGLKSFLAALEKVSAQSEKNTSWLNRTHPLIADRLKRVERHMAQRKMETEGRSTLAERYQARMSEAAQQ